MVFSKHANASIHLLWSGFQSPVKCQDTLLTSGLNKLFHDPLYTQLCSSHEATMMNDDVVVVVVMLCFFSVKQYV